MEYGKLRLERSDGIAIITLNRPDRSNAFDDGMIAEMHEALKTVEREGEIRCVVLTGSGKNFCAGQDLGALLERYNSPDRVHFRDHLLQSYNQMVVRIRTMAKPFIAAINGAAAGAGLGLACACDLRHAAENAKFRMAFIGIALSPDSATSFLLPRIIGLGRAAEMALTNEPIDAHQAHAYGLVNRIFPPEELLPKTLEFAKELAHAPTKSIGLTKRAFNRSMFADLEGALDYEAYLQEIAGQTQDHREGVRAFLEKRAPAYLGN
jgi:2-(1,2-epoxy-1,2-dihydrophenyl)acetyl-CoA isomerase